MNKSIYLILAAVLLVGFTATFNRSNNPLTTYQSFRPTYQKTNTTYNRTNVTYKPTPYNYEDFNLQLGLE